MTTNDTTPFQTRVDFAYSFATPHRLTVARPYSAVARRITGQIRMPPDAAATLDAVILHARLPRGLRAVSANPGLEIVTGGQALRWTKLVGDMDVVAEVSGESPAV